MVPPESLLFRGYGCGFTERVKDDRAGEIINGEDCFGSSDPTVNNINDRDCFGSSDPTVNNTSGNDRHEEYSRTNSGITSSSNDLDREEGWLRLGVGGRIETPRQYHRKDQQVADRTADMKDGFLDLNLFTGGCVSSTAASVPHAPTYQLGPLTMQQNYLSSAASSWMALTERCRFVPSFQNHLVRLNNDVNNINKYDKTHIAGSSSGEFRVIDPPRRPHSGMWFGLQASQNQSKEPFLPQVTKSYLRIRDGKMTVGLLKKYLVKKLHLDNETEIELRCRGQDLLPFLTIQHVRDAIWSPKASPSSSLPSSSSLGLLPDSTTDHVMILHYGRI